MGKNDILSLVKRVLIMLPVFGVFLACHTNIFAAPEIITPIPNSQLLDTTITFEWNPNDETVTYWILSIGSRVGEHDIFTQGFEPDVRSITVNNLPDDGRKLHVRLRYRINNELQFIDYVYTSWDPIQEVLTQIIALREEIENLSVENKSLKSRIEEFGASQVDLEIGEPSLKSPNTIHQAETDVFIQAWTGGPTPSAWNFYSGNTSPPVTQFARISDQNFSSATMLVRKGDYWVVQLDENSQRGAIAIYQTPLRAILKAFANSQ